METHDTILQVWTSLNDCCHITVHRLQQYSSYTPITNNNTTKSQSISNISFNNHSNSPNCLDLPSKLKRICFGVCVGVIEGDGEEAALLRRSSIVRVNVVKRCSAVNARSSAAIARANNTACTVQLQTG
jgi:hypothetical protein